MAEVAKDVVWWTYGIEGRFTPWRKSAFYLSAGLAYTPEKILESTLSVGGGNSNDALIRTALSEGDHLGDYKVKFGEVLLDVGAGWNWIDDTYTKNYGSLSWGLGFGVLVSDKPKVSFLVNHLTPSNHYESELQEEFTSKTEKYMLLRFIPYLQAGFGYNF